jgi:hypothetical protein
LRRRRTGSNREQPSCRSHKIIRNGFDSYTYTELNNSKYTHKHITNNTTQLVHHTCIIIAKWNAINIENIDRTRDWIWQRKRTHVWGLINTWAERKRERRIRIIVNQ